MSEINIDTLLAKLKNEKTAEQTFVETLAEKQAEVEVETSVEDTKYTAEELELRKIAEEYDQRGRLMARAFYDELNKLAAAEDEYLYDAAEKIASGEENTANQEVQLISPESEEILVNLYNKFYGGNQ